MLADERREELVRFERTFNLARLGGAGLAFVPSSILATVCRSGFPRSSVGSLVLRA